MKKWLIASGICLIPIILLGIVNPIGVLISSAKGNYVNTTIFLWYVGILSFCVAVVATTTIRMIRYASKIDKLEELEARDNMSHDRLTDLINHYNNLIQEAEEKQKNQHPCHNPSNKTV